MKYYLDLYLIGPTIFRISTSKSDLKFLLDFKRLFCKSVNCVSLSISFAPEAKIQESNNGVATLSGNDVTSHDTRCTSSWHARGEWSYLFRDIQGPSGRGVQSPSTPVCLGGRELEGQWGLIGGVTPLNTGAVRSKGVRDTIAYFHLKKPEGNSAETISYQKIAFSLGALFPLSRPQSDRNGTRCWCGVFSTSPGQ